MEDPELWRWVWLALAFTFAVGELTSPGSFFMAPFAVGAAVACVLGFLDVNVGIQWLAFVGISSGMFAGLRPLARRLDRAEPARGIGAQRLIHETGTVLSPIPAGPTELGLVRIGREEWRAESVDGTAIAENTTVKVIDVRGTRVVVWPVDRPMPIAPPSQEHD